MLSVRFAGIPLLSAHLIVMTATLEYNFPSVEMQILVKLSLFFFKTETATYTELISWGSPGLWAVTSESSQHCSAVHFSPFLSMPLRRLAWFLWRCQLHCFLTTSCSPASGWHFSELQRKIAGHSRQKITCWGRCRQQLPERRNLGMLRFRITVV